MRHAKEFISSNMNRRNFEMRDLNKLLQNLTLLSINRERERAFYIPYANEKTALEGKGDTPYRQMLNGEWNSSISCA